MSSEEEPTTPSPLLPAGCEPDPRPRFAASSKTLLPDDPDRWGALRSHLSAGAAKCDKLPARPPRGAEPSGLECLEVAFALAGSGASDEELGAERSRSVSADRDGSGGPPRPGDGVRSRGPGEGDRRGGPAGRVYGESVPGDPAFRLEPCEDCLGKVHGLLSLLDTLPFLRNELGEGVRSREDATDDARDVGREAGREGVRDGGREGWRDVGRERSTDGVREARGSLDETRDAV